MAEDLSVEQRTGFGLATLMARKGAGPEDLARVLGIVPPDGPRFATIDGLSLIGTGPGTWLAHREAAEPGFAWELAGRMAGIASVSDQSGGYVVWRLRGAGARTLLQRGAAIDLHPDAFPTGAVATTMIAHFGVVIRRLDDRPTYDVTLFRSFADSFRHWLDTTASAL